MSHYREDTDGAYVSWLHATTLLGYEKGLVITSEFAQLFWYYFRKHLTPSEAIEDYIIVCRRIRAIKKANG